MSTNQGRCIGSDLNVDDKDFARYLRTLIIFPDTESSLLAETVGPEAFKRERAKSIVRGCNDDSGTDTHLDARLS